MPKVDSAAVAFNAAGIADALACVESGDAELVARFEHVTAEHGGHLGIMQQVVGAAGYMERFRIRRGMSATWGGELPYLYDIWDAIAQAIWLSLDEEPLDQIVESAIRSAMNARPAS